MLPFRLTSRPRRLTARDLLAVVAILSLPLAAIGIEARSAKPPGEKGAVLIVTVGVLVLTLAGWWVAGIRTGRRWAWLAGPLTALALSLSAVALFGLVLLWCFSPVAGALIVGALWALVAYLVSWEGAGPGP